MLRAFFGLIITALFCGADFSTAQAVAPLCDARAGKAGAPAIVIQGKSFLPVFYAVQGSLTRDAAASPELRKARDNGITLFSFALPLDASTPSERIGEALDAFSQNCPDAYFYLRVCLDAPQAWSKAHPEDILACVDGRSPSYASASSAAWREEAARRLRARIREIAEGPHGDRFLGVELEAFDGGAWRYPPEIARDDSPVNLAAFRQWLRRAYFSERRLREAWGKDDVTFDSAAIPASASSAAATASAFLDPATQRPALDFARFTQESIVDAIAYFAGGVKQETTGRALVGAHYGDLFAQAETAPNALSQSGALALGRLLSCADLDLLHVPLDAFDGGAGQPGHVVSPIDSAALRGKLAILEDDRALRGDGQEALELARRDAAFAAERRCGYSLLATPETGTARPEKFWDSASLLLRFIAESRSEPTFRPEVAAFVDEASIAALTGSAGPFLQASLSRSRVELDRLGAPVGYYLQDDVARVPESVKLMIFLNPFALADIQRRAIDKFLKRGGVVIWIYAPALVQADGLDWDKARDVTGIALEPRPSRALSSAKLETVPGEIAITGGPWPPAVVVTDPDAQVLARYQDNDEVCIAAKPIGRGVSVYSALPNLPRALLRWICERAEVRLYHDQPAMTAVIGATLVTHVDAGGAVHFRWPVDATTANRIAPAHSGPLYVFERAWTDALPPKTTGVYVVQEGAAKKQP